jgi:hypothetical protein
MILQRLEFKYNQPLNSRARYCASAYCIRKCISIYITSERGSDALHRDYSARAIEMNIKIYACSVLLVTCTASLVLCMYGRALLWEP